MQRIYNKSPIEISPLYSQDSPKHNAMKSYNLFAVIIGTFSVLSAFSQYEPFESSTDSKIYMKIYGAYGLLTPGSFRGISNNDNNDSNVVKVQKRGMGGGFRAGAGFGIIVNEFINIGIDGEYLMGNKINVKVAAIEGSSIRTQSITTYEHQILSIIPNVAFKAISKPTYYIYNRVGIIVGIPLSIMENEKYEYQFKDPTAILGNIVQRDINITFNGEHTLKNSVGYQGVLGVQMILTEKLRGFCEIAAYGISFDRIKYEDIQRETKQIDIFAGVIEPKLNIDNSRYIRNYAKTGITNISVLPERTGTSNNYIYNSTSSQAPVNMNAITFGLGLAFRF